MVVFEVRDHLIGDYRSHAPSFVTVRDDYSFGKMEEALPERWLWPGPLLQMKASSESGGSISALSGGDMSRHQMERNREGDGSCMGAPIPGRKS